MINLHWITIISKGLNVSILADNIPYYLAQTGEVEKT